MLTVRRVRSSSTIRPSAAPPAAQIEDDPTTTTMSVPVSRTTPTTRESAGGQERTHRRDREDPRLRVDALERDRLPQAERVGDVRALRRPHPRGPGTPRRADRRSPRASARARPPAPPQQDADPGRHANHEQRRSRARAQDVGHRPAEPEPQPRRPEHRVVRAGRHGAHEREAHQRRQLVHDRSPAGSGWHRRHPRPGPPRSLVRSSRLGHAPRVGPRMEAGGSRHPRGLPRAVRRPRVPAAHARRVDGVHRRRGRDPLRPRDRGTAAPPAPG